MDFSKMIFSATEARARLLTYGYVTWVDDGYQEGAETLMRKALACKGSCPTDKEVAERVQREFEAAEKFINPPKEIGADLLSQVMAAKAMLDRGHDDTPVYRNTTLPELKASDLIKQGVLYVPERGEVPDPERFGDRLLIFAQAEYEGEVELPDWHIVSFRHGTWRTAEGSPVRAIDCWMLPPDLKK